LFDELWETGSWPRMAEIWNDGELVACDAIVCDEPKDIIEIGTVLSLDGSCPRPGLVGMDWATLPPPTSEDNEPDDDIVADWVWINPEFELKIETTAGDWTLLAPDNADLCVEEASATDDDILVGLSGGQETIPRQFRELAEGATFDEEPIVDEEAIEDETTEPLLVPELERLWRDGLCKAEPRTTVEDFTDAEETFGTEPLIALEPLFNTEETFVVVGLVMENEDSRDGEIVALDEIGAFTFVETRDVPEVSCSLLEVEAIFVSIEGIILELASFCEELRLLLDDVLVLVEVDARFTELEGLLLGVLNPELIVLFAELEATGLVSFEPRIGLVSRDELEALLDLSTTSAKDDAFLEFEDPLLELDACVDVVGRV
jgi:hypothetical protein